MKLKKGNKGASDNYKEFFRIKEFFIYYFF